MIQRSFIQPSKPATIHEDGTGSSEYGSEYGSEYESEYESESEGDSRGGAKPQSSSEDESDSEVEGDESVDPDGEVIGVALYDWDAPEDGQCPIALGRRYRVTHDTEALLAAGWIGVVPVAGEKAGNAGGGLVPRSYIHLPDSYQEGSVSATAAASAAAAVEDDTTSEYETDTETEEEEVGEDEDVADTIR